MTKSGKKASSKVSLKDFHKAVPGKVSPEHDLPSKPLGRNGSAYISTSTEKPSAGAASAPVTITSSSKNSNNPNNTSADADAAEAARFEPYCTLLKPQRPTTVLSPVAKEPQNIPLRPQLGPPSLLAPPPTPQQQHHHNPHHHHHQSPDPSAHVVSLQIDCYPELQPPPGAVLSGLSPGSLGYLNSFPSAAAGAFDNNDSPSRRNGHPSSQQQQPSLQQQYQSRGLPGRPLPPRQWATEVLVQKQQRLIAAPRQLQMQMHHHPQQQPTAAAPRAPSHHMSKSSSGPWAEEAAQIAKAQLANSSSGLVEEKKPQPALVKPSDPGQRPVLKIQPRTRPVEIPSAAPTPTTAAPSTATAAAAAAPPPPPPQGAYSRSPPSSSSSKSLSSSQSSHSSEGASSEPPATKPPGGAARPKLNLKPRSKPLEDDPAGSGPGGRRSSPFGGALPREVILNKRGEPVRPGDDPFDAPPASVSSVKGTAARPDSQSGWHTVHHRKSGGGAPPAAAAAGGGGGAVGGGGFLSDDPFFGDYAPPGRSLSALVSSFEQQPQNGLGGFRPLGGAFSTPSNCSTEADANPFTKRGLPMRSDDYF